MVRNPIWLVSTRIRTRPATVRTTARAKSACTCRTPRPTPFVCGWCARESAAFGRLTERYRARGVEVLAIHVQDAAADVRRFMRANRVTYPVALDPRLTIGNRYGFKGTPYTVVIDRQGEIVARLHGESAVTRLPRVLDEILKKEPPPA